MKAINYKNEACELINESVKPMKKDGQVIGEWHFYTFKNKWGKEFTKEASEVKVVEVEALPKKARKSTASKKVSAKTTAREYFGWLCREILIKRINEKAKEEGNAMIESISTRSLRGNELSEKQEWCLAFYAEKHQLSYFGCI